MNQLAEAELYRRDRPAWVTQAAPRIAALLVNMQGKLQASTWCMLMRDTQVAVSGLLSIEQTAGLIDALEGEAKSNMWAMLSRDGQIAVWGLLNTEQRESLSAARKEGAAANEIAVSQSRNYKDLR